MIEQHHTRMLLLNSIPKGVFLTMCGICDQNQLFAILLLDTTTREHEWNIKQMKKILIEKAKE